MASERRFSKPGGVPTEYEVELLKNALLQEAAEERHWMLVARALFRGLGPALGTRALLIVLDSVGAEKIRTPKREWMLFEIEREALIDQAEAMASAGHHSPEIARALGRSERWVRKHVRLRALRREAQKTDSEQAA